MNRTPSEAAIDAIVLQIATEELDLLTLATRNSDSLDFREHAVWSVRSALIRAFRAGMDHAKKETPPCI